MDKPKGGCALVSLILVSLVVDIIVLAFILYVLVAIVGFS